MAKARAIVKRRKAVRNTRKITKTMQMIATAKFQKSLKRAVGTKPFTYKVREVVADLVESVFVPEFGNNDANANLPAAGSIAAGLLYSALVGFSAPVWRGLFMGVAWAVGRSSGFIIAAGTVGSIAGVFVSGFVLIDHLRVSSIFRLMGVITGVLGIVCLVLDPRFRATQSERAE